MSIFKDGTVGLVRKTDPQTSHEAAKGILDDLTASQHQVLAVVRSATRHVVPGGPPSGVTHSELSARCEALYGDHGPSHWRSRCKQLVDKGLVKWSGDTRLNKRGNKEQVWIVTDEGKK